MPEMAAGLMALAFIFWLVIVAGAWALLRLFLWSIDRIFHD